VLRIQNPERRAHPRLSPSALSAILYVGEERSVVTIGDISLTGAKILNAPAGLKKGDTLKMTTCLHGHDMMTLVCNIAYVKGNAAQSVVGVRFENVEDSDTRMLVSYLHWLVNSEPESADPTFASG
jgi:hypothetical protein